MKNNIENLIKNVITENAVQFKEQANNVLYKKVASRLKNQYVNVSKKLFANINEASMASAGANMAPLSVEPSVYYGVEAATEPPMGPPSPGQPQHPSVGTQWLDTSTGVRYVWNGQDWVPMGEIPSDIPDWQVPGPGQFSAPPNPKDYYPGGFSGKPSEWPNNPSQNSPPPRSAFPKGPAGDEQHQRATEEYRERWKQYQKDMEEYNKWKQRNKAKPKGTNPPKGPGSGSGGSGVGPPGGRP